LRKDIEQLCMQQAGPSYLVVATRMHFQRYNFFFLSPNDLSSPFSLTPFIFCFLGGGIGKERKGVPVACLLVY